MFNFLLVNLLLFMLMMTLGCIASRSLSCFVHQGAGISTAAGIGDYRGKDGKWTDQDRHKEHGKYS